MKPITKMALVQAIKETLTAFETKRTQDPIWAFQCAALERMLVPLSRNIPYEYLASLISNAFSVGRDSIPNVSKMMLLAWTDSPYSALAIALNGGVPVPTRYYINALEYIDYAQEYAGAKFLTEITSNLEANDWDREHYHESTQAQKDLARQAKSARQTRGAAAAGPDITSLTEVHLVDASAALRDASVQSRSQEYVTGLVVLPESVGDTLVRGIEARQISVQDILPLVSTSIKPIAVNLNEAAQQLMETLGELLANGFALDLLAQKKEIASRYLPRTQIAYAQLDAWSLRAEDSIFTPDGLLRKLNNFWAYYHGMLFTEERKRAFPHATTEGERKQLLEQELHHLCVMFPLRSELSGTPAAHIVAYGSYQGRKDLFNELPEGFDHPKRFVREKKAEYEARLLALNLDSSSIAAFERECLQTMLRALDLYHRYGRSFLVKSLEAPALKLTNPERNNFYLLPQRLREESPGLDRNGRIKSLITSTGEFKALTEGGLAFEKILSQMMFTLESTLDQLFVSERASFAVLKKTLGNAHFDRWLHDLKLCILRYISNNIMMPASRFHLREEGLDVNLAALLIGSDHSEESYAEWFEATKIRDDRIAAQAQIRRFGLEAILADNLNSFRRCAESYDQARQQTLRLKLTDSADLGLLDLSSNQEVMTRVLQAVLNVAQASRDLEVWKILNTLVQRNPGLLASDTLAIAGISDAPLALTMGLEMANRDPISQLQRQLVGYTHIARSDEEQLVEILGRMRQIQHDYLHVQSERKAGMLHLADRLYRNNYPARSTETGEYVAACRQALAHSSEVMKTITVVYRELKRILDHRTGAKLTLGRLHGPVKERIIDPLQQFALTRFGLVLPEQEPIGAPVASYGGVSSGRARVATAFTVGAAAAGERKPLLAIEP